jgi:N-acetylglutamate synthase-like GNAT family acetyltransferase
MAALERLAREQGVSELLVPSSLTAQGFYRQLGFTVLREVIEGDERTLVMARQLPPLAAS